MFRIFELVGFDVVVLNVVDFLVVETVVLAVELVVVAEVVARVALVAELVVDFVVAAEVVAAVEPAVEAVVEVAWLVVTGAGVGINSNSLQQTTWLPKIEGMSFQPRWAVSVSGKNGLFIWT